MNAEVVHKPVLLKEAIGYLEIKPNGVYVDCTLGDGGYSRAILEKLEEGVLVSIDCDMQSIEFVRASFPDLLKKGNWKVEHDNFANVRNVLSRNEIMSVDGVVFDLGMSSRQLDADDLGRGFSYLGSDPLDMRMDMRLGVTAEDLVKGLSRKELTKLLSVYGEERYSKRIANSLKDWVDGNIDVPLTSDKVAALIREVVPAGYREGPRHPARRVFQALRIAVNDELQSLQQGVSSALSIVDSGGRVVVISYHSLEDRIVKQLFRDAAGSSDYVLLTRKPVVAQEREIEENSRARSAKLRAIERK